MYFTLPLQDSYSREEARRAKHKKKAPVAEITATEKEASDEWFESIGLGDEPTLPSSTFEGPPAEKRKGEDPKRPLSIHGKGSIIPTSRALIIVEINELCSRGLEFLISGLSN